VARKPFWQVRGLIGFPGGEGVFEEHLNAHFRQPLEFAEKGAVSLVILPQHDDGVVGTLHTTPEAHGNHGQVAIKGLDDARVGEKVRGIRRRVRFGKLGKCGSQAIVIRSEDTIPRHAVGNFEGHRKRSAKDAIN
jgi:hypothetical protein